MSYIIIIAVASGMIFGYSIIPENMINTLDNTASISLNIIILLVGIEVGCNKNLIKDLKENGIKILIIPLGIIIGSIFGGILTGLFYKIPINESLSVASGFGWYSLSGIMLTNLANAELGTIAFLTNVLRELIAVITIPFLASKLNDYTAIAPAGATSMDTTLPLISKATSPKIVIISFLNGVVLSSLVPILVTFFYSLN